MRFRLKMFPMNPRAVVEFLAPSCLAAAAYTRMWSQKRAMSSTIVRSATTVDRRLLGSQTEICRAYLRLLAAVPCGPRYTSTPF